MKKNLKRAAFSTFIFTFFICLNMSIANADCEKGYSQSSYSQTTTTGTNAGTVRSENCVKDAPAGAPGTVGSPEKAAVIMKYIANDSLGKKCVQEDFSVNPGPTEKAYSASSPMAFCLELTGGHIKNLVKSKRETPITWIDSTIAYTCSKECEKISVLNSGIRTANVANDAQLEEATQKLKKLNKCVIDNMKEAKKCVVSAYLIDAFNRDWGTDQTRSVGGNDSSKQAVIVAGQNGMSVNGQGALECKSRGIETLDYDACKEFSDYAQGLELAHQAIGTGQTLVYQNKAMDTQMEATKNMASDATAGLKAQKSNFKDQQEYFAQNSAIEASKAAILLTKYKAMPEVEDIKAQCNGVNSVAGSYNQAVIELGGTSSDLTGSCQELVASTSFAFMMNSQMKDKMKQKLVSLGVSAIAEGTKSYFAGKRADQVGDAIAGVNNFKPTTSAGLEEAIDTSFCQMNPNAPKCVNNMPQAFSTIGENIVDFGGNGTGTVYSGAEVADSTTATNGSVKDGSTSKSTKTIGSAIVASNKGSGLETKVAPADITKGSAPAGGGGGGGSGGGASGGGGGSAPPAQGQAGGTTSAIAGKAPSYGGGGFSILGGLGIKKAVATNTAGNPFGSLFDKNKNTDKMVNFRGPASDKVGDKGDNIFNIITKRYNWANNQKLMLEYEDTAK